MVSVKICGVRDPDTAQAAFDAGADYVGLVLTSSRRQVSGEVATAIVQTVQGKFVAVLKDPTPEQWRVALSLPFYAVQCHPPEPTGWIDQVHRAGKRAIATRLTDEADVVLLDGPEPGSGRGWSWHRPQFSRPIWLAGGLRVDNVREIVRQLRPDGVDVSSGVECAGQKDRQLIRAFILEVRHGFES
jgi:phosphoribosylanthranilate isomerase